VILRDITTAPATYYVWDGAKYVPTLTSDGSFNNRVTSYTAISAPTALSTSAPTYGLISTATTGGTIPASSTYRLAVTYVDSSGGETLISVDSASTATIATGSGTSTNTISVTSPAAATGAVGYRVYMTAASGGTGTEILYSPTCTATQLQYTLPSGTVCAIGSTATISAIITGTAKVPVLTSAYPRTSGASANFPPFTAAGTVSSGTTQTLAAINIPAGFLNTVGRSMQVCGNGYATTNGTGGTITLAGSIASVPGVTTVGQFTAVSPAIAASVIQVPIDFCITLTTATTGATGTVETHGWVMYGVAGTAVASTSMDFVFTAGSATNLTTADQLALTITPTTAGLSAAQIRQLSVLTIN